MVKRVLHVVPSFSVEAGGPPRVVAQLAESLTQRGVRCSIFSTDSYRSGNIVRARGVDVRIFPTSRLNTMWRGHSVSLARSLKEAVKDCDLVHIHGLWSYPHFAAYKAAKREGRPFVVTLHGTLDPYVLSLKKIRKRLYMSLIQRHILNSASAILALTQEEARQVKELGLNTRVFVIPNGLHVEDFLQLPLREEFDAQYPELKDRIVIIFLGRIHPKKGLDMLARSFGEIALKIDNVSLLVAGPDEEGYKRDIELILLEHNLLQKVVFPGVLVERSKLAALSRADIFVLPSYSEGFSVAILEALAAGLPVVITRQCYFPEVADAKAGVVVDINEAQLVESLLLLTTSSRVRRKMGMNARRLVRQTFTWGRVADTVIEAYNKVVRKW